MKDDLKWIAYFMAIICLNLLVYFCATSSTSISTCKLPNQCRIQFWDSLYQWSANRPFKKSSKKGIQCVIDNINYKFDFASWLSVNKSMQCNRNDFDGLIEWRFTKKPNVMLVNDFGLQGFVDFMLMNYNEILFRFTNLNGIDLNLGIALFLEKNYNMESNRYTLEFINSRFDFYTKDRRLVSSCSDMVDINETRSIFQLNAHYYGSIIYFIRCEFKRPMCPRIFNNTNIQEMYFTGILDYYYKKNILTFINHTFEKLNSTVFNVVFYKSENIAINSKLLHPEVFKKLESFTVYDGYREIQSDVFSAFRFLKTIQLEANYWNRLIHKQGIEWIKGIKG